MAYCFECQRRFPHQAALQQHIADSPVHRVHECAKCRKEFTKRSSLIQHWTMSPRHFYCEDCDEHFDDHEDLQYHDWTVHFFCSACKLVCVSSVNRHAETDQNTRFTTISMILRTILRPSTITVGCVKRSVKRFVGRASLVLPISCNEALSSGRRSSCAQHDQC